MSGVVPATVWAPTDGNSEASVPGVAEIVDASGLLLVDSSANIIADSGNAFTIIPVTVWTEDNSQ